MNITSYNVTDVGYHYIGLRVLAGLPPTALREEQTSTIARNIRKYVNDTALRLMLPEPRSTFESTGAKVCQELVHLNFARSVRRAYELTDQGRHVLALLDGKKHSELRRKMLIAHLSTYDNLRLVVKKHLELSAIWRPVVAADRLDDVDYLTSLLVPTFGDESSNLVTEILSNGDVHTPKRIEDELTRLILGKVVPEVRLGVPMFRAMCDRLVSLRMLNQRRTTIEGDEFLKSYTPCVATDPPNEWYKFVELRLDSGGKFRFYYCEPDMSKTEPRNELSKTIRKTFTKSDPIAGYFDLPELRDNVSETLRIPEATFDEGLNAILDQDDSPFTVGLRYEGTSGRRKPLVRSRGSTQIFNLITEV